MVDPHSFIDRDRIVRRTVELVRIPSVNRFGGPDGVETGEVAVVAGLERHLDRLGFGPVVSEASPGRPNIVAVGPGGDGPVVALVGHTDTVGVAGYDDPFSGAIREGRVHGRGTCDMKGALAAFLEVAEALVAANTHLRGRLMIAGVADEEHTMMGSVALGEAGALADHVIVGEPTDLAICAAHLGQYAFPIRTHGKSAHSSIPEQGINAIEHMTEIIAMLGTYRAELASRPAHPLCGPAQVNPGVISGGDMVSIVPDFCELEVDRRVVPGETSDDVRRELETLLEALALGRPDFRWEIGEPTIQAAPLDTPTSDAVVRAAQHAMTTWAMPATVGAFPAATDAPNLGGSAIIWGPGSLLQAHTTDEWVAVDDLERAAHLYLDAVLELIGAG